MRRAVIVAVAVLCAGAPAIADDNAATKPDGGKLEVVPPPQGPAKPPDLSVPPPTVAPPESPAPPAGKFEQHQEPAPRGQAPDDLPRGEGAAAIPKEKPTGVKMIEEWIASWFE